MSPSRTSTRGFTLIDIVLVMGSLTIVLGLCGGLLRVLLKLERDGRSHLVETATVGRLARQFRQDVHAAIRVQPAGGEAPVARLELALPDGRIAVYEARGTGLDRTQHRGAALERRESYSLPFFRDPRFVVRVAGGRIWASLKLPRSAGTDAGPNALRHDLQIDALAGRDHRLSPAGGTAP